MFSVSHCSFNWKATPRVGMPGVINSLTKEGLPLSEVTVANYLKSMSGYKTMVLGKWHQGQRA